MKIPSCDWLHFAERHGPQGRDWAQEYRRHLPAVELGLRALQHMREGQLEKGGEFLRELISDVEGVCGDPASVRAVLDRFRYGIEGYYLYCRRDFANAQKSMCLAHAAVERALTTAGWLRLLAVHCQEFRLHQARIARNQRRWLEMQALIAQAHAMMSDQLPLCETKDGQKIWWSSLQPFFAALEPLTADEARVAHNLLNAQERERLFDQFVRGMLRFSRNSVRYA